ncbi:MAG: lipocalin family protein [Candidatus Sericytochromatia bacterium]
MNKIIILLLITFSFFITSCEEKKINLVPLETVSNVDVKKYMGKWYEIANIPFEQQKDCVATSATYTLRDDGKVDVFNECREKTLNGNLKNIKAIARIVDTKTNAKLKVNFFFIIEGDYWVIDLDENYNYAVVGEPSRKFSWILSRTPSLDENTYKKIINKLEKNGYDTSKFVKTKQY